MANREKQGGFTIIEAIVTLGVMSMFLILFFQVYFSSESQRIGVIRKAAAEDLAATNLSKFTKKADLPSTTPPCTNTASSQNNPTTNPAAAGSNIPATTGTPPATPHWMKEPEEAPLRDSDTDQELKVLYPKGCSGGPVTIVSVVTYGSESVRRAAFIN